MDVQCVIDMDAYIVLFYLACNVPPPSTRFFLALFSLPARLERLQPLLGAVNATLAFYSCAACFSQRSPYGIVNFLLVGFSFIPFQPAKEQRWQGVIASSANGD